MTDRERLAELIRDKTCGNNACIPFLDCEKCGNFPLADKDVDRLVDRILADGWMRPPFTIGQTVYVLRSKTSNGKNLYLKEERVDHYRVFKDGRFMCFESGRTSVSDHLWETSVFPTREEAEKALRGGESDA